MEIIEQLIQEFKLKRTQVKNTIELIDEGNTIPFIARYRKEKTGQLDDIILRELSERLIYIRNMESKKEEITRLIEEQGKLTEEIKREIFKATTIQRLDDLYRPFRPKRRTRATIAIEKGLEPIAKDIMDGSNNTSVEELAKHFIDVDHELESIDLVIKGAKDIIAEWISDNADYRATIRKNIFEKSAISTEKNNSKKNTENIDYSTYEMYFEYSEPLKKIANHRVLAINRGEKEKALKVKIDSLEETINSILIEKIIIDKNRKNSSYLEEAILDSYKRLIFPSIEREIRNELTEEAEEQAIKVFGKNLKPLLLQSPIKDTVVMGFDPAYRTGCKIAVIDGTGKLLDYTTIYPTEPQNKVEEAKKTMTKLIEKYNIKIIAIGNGTGSRESESVVSSLIKEMKGIYYTIVDEAGASVYSASKIGAEEYPDINVSIRGAISIGRRLQDPLAELVKIDPKHIGVGQYQHDLNQPKLEGTLKGVVEDCVNSVGIDLNTASVSLLSYVSGITPSIAKNIYNCREENGKFKNRKELLKVKRLGQSAFTQSAGFLRIVDGDNMLDNTGIHPEAYDPLKKLFEKLNLNMSLEDIKDFDFTSIKKNIGEISREIGIGEITLNDIIKEIKKPGRDPRDEMPKPIFRTDVVKMEDLKIGMILPGTIRNVVDFGAFIDIGVKQDGLVHISQLSNKYVKNPMDIVSIGDKVDVKIIDLDIDKKKIGLSMKEC